ncbi:MAG: DMT family transporter [Proteobacteria bacterium]|nr:MAG: DMT family transporter [Pseudomonadota bacterium]TDJ69010.1 MAG: DMT family transporter [Pseudomonadota bacterium]
MPYQLLYLFTVLIWGSTWLAITFQLGVVDPIWSVAYRFALAAAVLMVFCLVTRRGLRFGLRDHGFMALQGTFLFCLNYILFYFSIEHVTSGLIAVIFSTIVFMNIVNGAMLLGTPIRARVLAGASLGLLGITLVFWPEFQAFSASSATIVGVSLALVATWFASLGNMASLRNQRTGLGVIESNTFGMAYGAALTTIVALVVGVEFRFDWSLSYVGSLAYLSIVGSVIAFGCYLSLLGRIGADRGAYTGVMFPIVALVLSTLFESYTWSGPVFIGVVMALAGNVLVLTRTKQSHTPAG